MEFLQLQHGLEIKGTPHPPHWIFLLSAQCDTCEGVKRCKAIACTDRIKCPWDRNAWGSEDLPVQCSAFSIISFWRVLAEDSLVAADSTGVLSLLLASAVTLSRLISSV